MNETKVIHVYDYHLHRSSKSEAEKMASSTPSRGQGTVSEESQIGQSFTTTVLVHMLLIITLQLFIHHISNNCSQLGESKVLTL